MTVSSDVYQKINNAQSSKQLQLTKKLNLAKKHLWATEHSKAGPLSIQFYFILKKGIGKLPCLKVDIGKILGKFPWMSKMPLQGNGMAAIPKIINLSPLN